MYYPPPPAYLLPGHLLISPVMSQILSKCLDGAGHPDLNCWEQRSTVDFYPAIERVVEAGDCLGRISSEATQFGRD